MTRAAEQRELEERARGEAKRPVFHKVAAGDYETADGRYRLLQLDGGATRAWNVELGTDYAYELAERGGTVDQLIVDGAATKRDAILLFGAWWRARQEELALIRVRIAELGEEAAAYWVAGHYIDHREAINEKALLELRLEQEEGRA